MKPARDALYRRHRFPAELISYAVWLYFRFPLSLRMVEEMLAASPWLTRPSLLIVAEHLTLDVKMPM
jgi:hypothetical protein